MSYFFYNNNPIIPGNFVFPIFFLTKSAFCVKTQFRVTTLYSNKFKFVSQACKPILHLLKSVLKYKIYPCGQNIRVCKINKLVYG